MERAKIQEMKLACYLNIAGCCIKSGDFDTGVKAADQALQLDPKNHKALYRRARAYAMPINAGVEEYQKALVDLR